MLKVIPGVLLAITLVSGAAATENTESVEVSTTSIGLRGGFDGNPSNIKGERGSPAAAIFATWDYINGSAQDGVSANLTLGEIRYDPRVLSAGRSNMLTLKHAFSLGEATTIQSALIANAEQSWSRRRESLALRERIDHRIGDIRLFASAEARVTALNERNIFNLGDFLPRDENFTTVTGTAGAAWRLGESEIGLSFTAARTRFIDGVDYLGLHRDHQRLQPNLFLSSKIGEATLEGSLSPFRANFPAKDFETVASLLYTAKLRLPYKIAALELSSGRTTEDTTLPFSVIDIVTSHEAKLTAQIDTTNAVGISLRQKTDEYVGLDARSRQRSATLDYQRAFSRGFTGTAAVGLREVKETGLTRVASVNLMLGLQKQIDFSGRKAKAE